MKGYIRKELKIIDVTERSTDFRNKWKEYIESLEENLCGKKF
jgi:hypothetical protein